MVPIEPGLFLNALLNVLLAGLFGLVCHATRKRPAQPELRPGRIAACVFWGSLAAYYLVVGLVSVQAALARPDLAIYVTGMHVGLVAGCGALAAWVGWMAFVWSGRSAALRASGALGGALFVLAEYQAAASHVEAVHARAWTLQPVFTAEAPLWSGIALAFVLLAAFLVLGIGQLVVMREVPDRRARVRLIALSGALLGTSIGWPLVAWLLPAEDQGPVLLLITGLLSMGVCLPHLQERWSGVGVTGAVPGPRNVQEGGAPLAGHEAERVGPVPDAGRVAVFGVSGRL